MKRKLPLLSLLVILLLVSNLFFQRDKTPKASADLQSSTPTGEKKPLSLLSIQPLTTQQPVQRYYPPKVVSIPKIGLTAKVDSVGLNNENEMDVPNNFVDVGWYNLGAMPGQFGSTVLDGHSDNFHGDPAVFYYLDTLQKGDKIFVTDQNGKTFTYTVTDNIVYPENALPNHYIYASNDKVRLNLITCHGQWDSSIQTYNQRTVIYSVLTGSSSS